MVRLKLTLAYHGAEFHGWQAQEDEAGTRAVQTEVERAAARLLGRPGELVRVHGAGRTDAGVHALGQVAHLDVPADKAALPWRRGLNALLPPDVAVVRAETAPDGFHARFSATSKIYAYTLWLARDFVLPQRRPFVWPVGRLDLDRLDEAGALFPGEHDFSAFQNAGTPVKSPVRRMFALWREPGQTPEETVLRLHADGFLKQMVRNIVGCLVGVGLGKLEPDAVRRLLAGAPRAQAPATAPARGLCLEQVFYGDESGRPPERPAALVADAPPEVTS